MKTMRWMCACLCLGLLAFGCSNYGDTKDEFQAPVLSSDAANVVDLKGTINFGERVSGNFSTEKALTGYLFDAHLGARVTVVLSSTNGEDPVLLVYGPVDAKGIWGAHIALDDDTKDGRNSVISNLALPASGRYLLALASFDGSSGGPFDLLLGCSGNCDEPHCPDVACDLYCANGFMTDPDGCAICMCVPEECQTDEDCLVYDWTTVPPQCIDGQCVYDPLYCDDSVPCPPGFECVFGPCPGAPCTEDWCPPCESHCEPVQQPGCFSDADCPPGHICVGLPVDCDASNPDCVPGGCGSDDPDCMPFAGVCIPEPQTCDDGIACPPGFECVVECFPCPAGDPACDETDPNCVGHCLPVPMECGSDAECPEGFECLMECWDIVCDPSTGETCPEECDPATGECYPHCVGHCVPSQNQCVTDEDCLFPDGVIGHCINGRCVYDEIPCDDSSGAGCPPGMVCQMVCWDCAPGDPDCVPGCEGFCVPDQVQCWVDTDCISSDGNLGRCVNGQCVFDPLYCSTDWECPPGFTCEIAECWSGGCDPATGECPPDCDPATGECPPNCIGICVPDHQNECFTDEDCIIQTPDGRVIFGQCIGGLCVFDPCACPDVWDPVCAQVCYILPDCPPGETCDQTCPDGQPCTEVCELVTFSNACDAQCAGAFIVHPGTCEDDPQHCLSDADCPPGMYCEFCIGPDGSMGPCYDTGTCRPLPNMECQSDLDCPDGFRCELGPCPDMPCDPDGTCPPCWGQCVPTDGQCIVTGCSGEICAPFHVNSTCVWLPEYECLALTTCELLTTPNGNQTCGWVQTPEYLACLESIYGADECNSDADCPPGMGCMTYCDEVVGCQARCYPMDCVCPEYFDPVCGTNGQTYDNICFASCDGVDMLHPGTCDGSSP